MPGESRRVPAAFQAAIEPGRQIRIQHRRMDITFSADGHGISKMAGNRFHRFDDIFLPLADRWARFHFAKSIGRQDGSIPGTEILGRELVSADFADIRVHIDGSNRVCFAVLHVLK